MSELTLEDVPVNGGPVDDVPTDDVPVAPQDVQDDEQDLQAGDVPDGNLQDNQQDADLQDDAVLDDDRQVTAEEKNGESNEQMDVYSYTQRAEFTSEIFKIEIKNLPRYVTPAELKKMFKNKFQLDTKKIKVMKGNGYNPNFGFVTFSNDADRDSAIEKANNFVYKKCKLQVTKAKPAKDPALEKKNQRDANDEPAINYDQLSEDELREMLLNQVCPLWSKDYTTQLEEKAAGHRELLTGLLAEIRHLYDWTSKKDAEIDNAVANFYKGIKCANEDPSNYRNKCEFTIGMDGTVGFRLGTYRDDNVKVIKPVNCPLVNERMVKLVDVFERFLKTSELKPFNVYTHLGHLKQITVRTTKRGCMLIVDINRDAELDEQRLNDEIGRLVSLIRDEANYVTSAYVQVTGRQMNSEGKKGNELRHVLGDQHLIEEMRNDELQYRISPFAFFQVNPKTTEILYETIADLASLNSNTILLDICCGVGTIGIYLAKQKVKHVLGVELNKEAVEDAMHNAERNKVQNIEFYAGLAETNMSQILKRAKQLDPSGSAEIVAILDPPRSGLKNSIIRLIRNCDEINCLVYVACEPKQSKQNLIDLCRPASKAYQGTPFEIMKAVSVDMFPHTKNCELVMLLCRGDAAEKEAKRTVKVEHCTEPCDAVKPPAGTSDRTMDELCDSESVPTVQSGYEQTNVETRPESSVLNCNNQIDEKEVKKTAEQTAEQAERSIEETERSIEETARSEDTTEQIAERSAVDGKGDVTESMIVEQSDALDDPEKAAKRARIV